MIVVLFRCHFSHLFVFQLQVVHVAQISEEKSTWNPDYSKHIDAKAKELQPMLEAHEKDKEGWQ